MPRHRCITTAIAAVILVGASGYVTACPAANKPAIAATTQPAATAATTPSWGHEIGLSINDYLDLGQKRAGVSAKVVAATNVATHTPAWVPERDDAEWRDPGTFSHTTIAHAIRVAARTHHAVLAIVGYAPAKWASAAALAAQPPNPAGSCQGTYICGVSFTAAHAYAQDTVNVAKYCVAWHVKCAIELWNEPNIKEFWKPRPAPAVYGSLVNAACPAIKRVSTAIPCILGGLAPVATGGGNYAPPDFYRAMLKWLAQHPVHGCVLHCIDGFATHPYDNLVQSTQVAQAMKQFGYGRLKIWATEVGTCHPDAPGVFTNFIRSWFANSWAGPVFWFTWQDAGCIHGLVSDTGVPHQLKSTVLHAASQRDR